MSGRTYLQVPSMNMDGPSDTRSQGSDHRSSHGGSQSGRSQHGGSQAGSTHSHSHVGSQAGSRPPSEAGPAPSQTTRAYPAPLGYDPGREKKPDDDRPNPRYDLPPEAFMPYNANGTPFARRPANGKLGKAVKIQVNQFRVAGLPDKDVHQYDVSLSPEPPVQGFRRKVWETRLVQSKLTNGGKFKGTWLYDGRNLAWSTVAAPEMRFKVDMDAEKGRPTRPGAPDNNWYFTIKKTTTIRLALLKAYLDGKMPWDNAILECMSFLDHVIRQTPSKNLLAIKRNFYNMAREKDGLVLDPRQGCVIAHKGIYASIRLNSSLAIGGTGLGINVDVANTTFWNGGQISFAIFVQHFLWSQKREYDGMRFIELADALKPEPYHDPKNPGRGVTYCMSEMFKSLRKLQKLRFYCRYRGKENDHNVYTIKKFVFDDKKYGAEGANSRNFIFMLPENGGIKRGGTERPVSVEEYFKSRYNIYLEHPRLPLIETTRHGVFPMEIVHLEKWQRYNFKLSPDMTASMIKFAVTRPPIRGKAIMDNVNILGWNQDNVLKEFGIRIAPEMQPVPARVIPNPEIQFAKGKLNPRMAGRWDLRGQIFVGPNVRPIKAWSVVVINNCLDQPTIKRFVDTFVKVFKGHGGKVENPQPKLYVLMAAQTKKMGDDVEKLYQQTGNAFQAPPDIMFFVLPDKNLMLYERLKKSMDVRFATITQMVQAAHVVKAQPQYCSNVSMKVNAKLGGQTSRIASTGTASAFFTAPTMMIGVDVSHGSPGQNTASMAAITVSMDKDAATYAAVCQTNGARVEVLTPSNIRSIFPQVVTKWCQKMGTAPAHVYYLRDGLDEGQFGKVMEYEIEEVRKILESVGRNKPKITVIIATKRHHIRFFPGSGGDKNQNALPGTVIEHEITHPFHYDFYLCSHVAIQGTARPVHYTVIHDEIGATPDALQKMLYQQCYQYIRSTTPVSLHPAVYYAHLASSRARSHEDIAASERDPFIRAMNMHLPLAKHNDDAPPSSSRLRQATLPLLEIGGGGGANQRNTDFFKMTMWYI